MRCPKYLIIPVIALAASCAAQTVEFVMEPPATPSSHASTVLELPDGDILAAWFGGTREAAPDVGIWLGRRTKTGWEKPVEVVKEPEIACFNPVLFQVGNKVWLYYKFGPHPHNWTAGRIYSEDNGRTWSKPEHLPAGLYGPIRAKPLILKDGTIISGTSVESYGSWACWIERSTDGGKTWSRFGPIAGPAPAATAERKPGSSTGIIQPAIVQLPNGRLRLFARSTRDIGRICISDSADGGRSWTPAAAISLPNPNSGIDVVRLKDGRYVMVYNHSATERTPLNLAVSKDASEWRMFKVLEDQPGQYSYPALIQAKNGDLLLTYTWHRKNIRFVRVPLADVR